MYDKNKLSRDYSLNPVQPKEIINKADLNYLYNECGIKIPELTKILGTTVHTLYKNLHLHNIMRVSSCVSKETEAKVDYTKLSRDFRVQPLAKNEPPKKEDFEYLYITLDLSKEEVAEVFGRGTSARFASKWITILGLQKPTELARAFLDANHVQGRTIGHICLGLYHGKELMALMEFITNPLNKEYQYELNRFCGKAGYNVLGGASKLFSYFIKTYNPTSIISYSDIAKTRGHLYEVLGFKNVGTAKLQYHWTNGEITFTRYETQRKQLIRKGLMLENDPRSEIQVMHNLEYYRIWDCGKIQWGWQKQK